MAASTDEPITVYFDGECPVCSREVALYRRLPHRAPIFWLDLAAPGDPLRGENFDLGAALELLHVKDGAGRLHVGLDAHLLMWQRLPGLHVLAGTLARWPGVRRPFESLYLAFTRHRPGLVRRRARGAAHRG
jgi:predicted DCC family thiol-disulfide oxidoreductase YuxK